MLISVFCDSLVWYVLHGCIFGFKHFTSVLGIVVRCNTAAGPLGCPSHVHVFVYQTSSQMSLFMEDKPPTDVKFNLFLIFIILVDLADLILHLLSLIIAIIDYISFLSYDMNCFSLCALKETVCLVHWAKSFSQSAARLIFMPLACAKQEKEGQRQPKWEGGGTSMGNRILFAC